MDDTPSGGREKAVQVRLPNSVMAAELPPCCAAAECPSQGGWVQALQQGFQRSLRQLQPVYLPACLALACIGQISVYSQAVCMWPEWQTCEISMWTQSMHVASCWGCKPAAVMQGTESTADSVGGVWTGQRQHAIAHLHVTLTQGVTCCLAACTCHIYACCT